MTSHRLICWAASSALTLALFLTLLTSSAAIETPTVTISGTNVHVDGRASFLLGVSLFDALGSAPPRVADLDALQNWGVTTVRVWAHWHEPIYGRDGALTADGRTRLLKLVERLQGRRMIMELVLLRPGQLPGQPYAIFTSEGARINAARSVTTALVHARNVVFDLYNEHDHSDGPISHAQARVLRDAIKTIDPNRLVTISSTESHLITGDGQVGEDQARNLREEAGEGAGSVGVDLVAAHFPRTDNWASATGSRVAALRAALDRAGRALPIYLNEERRAEASDAVDPGAYQVALAAARQAGAAGWVFHTAAGFDLKGRPFVEALMPNEKVALSRLNEKRQ